MVITPHSAGSLRHLLPRRVRFAVFAGAFAVAWIGGALVAPGDLPPQPAKPTRAAPTADHPTNPAVRARLKLAGPPEKVVELGLSNADLSDTDLVCLTKLPNLEKLSIAGNRGLSSRGIGRLASLSKLRRLDFPAAKYCLDDVLAIKSLEQLQFGIGFNSAPDLRALAGLPYLRELDIRSDTAVDEALGGIENLVQLRILHLDAEVTDAGLRHLRALMNLEELDISDVGRKITGHGLESLAGLPKLRRLSLRGSALTDEGMKHAASLRHLESLDISFCRVSDVGLKQLGALSDLRELNLYATQVGDAGLGALKGMRQLHKLNLGGTKITSDGVETIGQLTSLEELDLGRTNITQAVRERKASPPSDDPFSSPPPPGPETVELGSRPALGHLKQLVRLRKLGLAGVHRFNGDGLDQLAGLPQLAELDLSEDSINIAGQKQLLTLPHLERLVGSRFGLDAARFDLRNLQGLRELDMREGWYSAFSFRPGRELPNLRTLRLTAGLGLAQNAVSLGSLSQLPALREVELGSPYLENAGIVQQTGLAQVETLDLDAPSVTDDGLKFLDGWKNLKELTLHCYLTDAGVAPIARLTDLRKLTIANTWITDAGLKRLSPLGNLRRLDVSSTACTPAGVGALQSVLPDCEIISGGPAPPPPKKFTVPDGWIQ